ncbi:MAG: radical SAM protein [Campylobacteraceae bacterium]|jgi:wyosine [tRNA(Phe)-imidazoG37] synthetase (radical SAM superfamily)|nr:radical SAM protein [Campylobacteraceae bacterium]MBT3881868.1 radical SAM protein [Campylobacteraceae bacterium]MBT4030352.1 radical SAM protein [Campylobacteraceae bacterium]MBT4179407.1 radical SAM protein [Campylobacteraceae bacterium]MBT4572758.1 radical SAM protein [Campylobacteraceae bacterium]
MLNLTFGPIPSRRFGMSLGVDLSAASKQCNFDCLYCELAPAKTVDKQTYISSVEDIISEVKKSLKNHPNIDVITFTANGEPTLYPYLEELIEQIDNIKGDIKTLILSNGANIYDSNIQRILSKIDIVKLSLDCVSAKCFKKIDRAHKDVNCDAIVDGIVSFRKIYKKELVIETLFVKDLNDSDSEINLLYNAYNKINPHRIDIGTIDRPPAYDVNPLTFEQLELIANKLNGLPITIAHKNRPKSLQYYSENEIINLLKMRPLTHDDIENIFDNNSKIIFDNLLINNIIHKKNIAGVDFYKSI